MTAVRTGPDVAYRPRGGDWLPQVVSVPDPWTADRTLHLTRAWPRSAEHVLIEYRQQEPAGGTVVGQWFADGQRLHHVASAMRTVGGHGAARPLPAHGIVLHGHGADRRLRALRGILASRSAALVVHRPERRAVVRLDGDRGAGAPRRWAKIMRAERLPALLARAGHLHALQATPRLLEVRHEQGVTVWEDVPGEALGTLLTDDQAHRAMAQTGVLLRRLHSLPPPDDPSLRHDAMAEGAVLATWLGHLRAFDPTTHPRAAALHRDVVNRLATPASTPRPLVTVHRDVHDGQVLVTNSGVHLLDLDTVGAGEAELDLGNLSAHLRLAAVEGRIDRDGADRLFGTLLGAYGTDRIDRQRLHAYTVAALLRLVGVHALRPATRGALPGLLDAVVDAQGGRHGPWPG